MWVRLESLEKSVTTNVGFPSKLAQQFRLVECVVVMLHFVSRVDILSLHIDGEKKSSNRKAPSRYMIGKATNRFKSLLLLKHTTI